MRRLFQKPGQNGIEFGIFLKGHYEFDYIVILRNDNEWVKVKGTDGGGTVRAVRP
jgi:hypothetical protein